MNQLTDSTRQTEMEADRLLLNGVEELEKELINSVNSMSEIDTRIYSKLKDVELEIKRKKIDESI